MQEFDKDGKVAFIVALEMRDKEVMIYMSSEAWCLEACGWCFNPYDSIVFKYLGSRNFVLYYAKTCRKEGGQGSKKGSLEVIDNFVPKGRGLWLRSNHGVTQR